MGMPDDTTETEMCNRLEAAAIDGRGRNVRYRQNQLHALHRWLRENSDAICIAIARDGDFLAEEAELEFFLVMSALVELYKRLNFEESLEQEYAISNTKNNESRRIPYGIVLIRPEGHTPLYSLMSPLVAAIAAGNCVLVEMPPTTRQIDGLLCQALNVLDHDICAIVSKTVSDENFLSKCLIVDQSTTAQEPDTNCLVSDAQALNIAIVDRTANLLEAAKAIISARSSFGGKSPNAPDIVLVNEFVKQDFIKGCLSQITNTTASLATKPAIRSLTPKPNLPYSTDSTHTIFDSDHIKFLDLHNIHNTEIQKTTSRTLIIASTTGLVDSVTIASKLQKLNACYHFADPKSAKFLSQHIDGKITFVNQIPAHVLVGPAFPSTLTSKMNPHLRYDTDMMSLSRPELITLEETHLRTASQFFYQENSNLTIQDLRKRSITPLTPTGQASGTSMGFFDQGIITGLVAFVLPTVGILGFGIYKGVQVGLRKYHP